MQGNEEACDSFRFESLGEVVHYMRQQQLNAHKFKVCYVFDLALE
jgi:hypothetical protein